MARLIRAPVKVAASCGQPVGFEWRRRSYQIVECVDDWRDTGEWWLGEPCKDFWRVRTSEGGCFDLYYEPQSGNWTLYREND